MNTVFMRLDGIMMSFATSEWNVRYTASQPTRSMVIGLIACCMGIWDIAPLSADLRIGYREERRGTVLHDFQTVKGDHMTAEGNIKKDYTEILEKSYLVDAAFKVAVRRLDGGDIGDIAMALQNPVWVPFLGRANCTPSVPIFAGVGDYPDLESALRGDGYAYVEDDNGMGLPDRSGVWLVREVRYAVA